MITLNYKLAACRLFLFNVMFLSISGVLIMHRMNYKTPLYFRTAVSVDKQAECHIDQLLTAYTVHILCRNQSCTREFAQTLERNRRTNGHQEYSPNTKWNEMDNSRNKSSVNTFPLYVPWAFQQSCEMLEG